MEIIVNKVNDAPSAIDQWVSTNEDVSKSIELAGSDPDGDSLTYALASPPSNGSVTLNGSTATYVPSLNYNGSDSFSFTVSDEMSTSSSAAVSITVNKVNDVPSAKPLSFSTNEDVSKSVELVGSDPDGDNLTYVLTSQPSQGSASLSSSTVTYTPSANYNGIDSFGFKVSDGIAISEAAPVSVTVTAINDSPVLNSVGDQNITEGSFSEFSLVGSDVDGDMLTYSVSGHPSGSVLSGDTFTWTPTLEDAGIYEVRFTARDTEGLEASETVIITVLNENQEPTLKVMGDLEVDEGEELLLVLLSLIHI